MNTRDRIFNHISKERQVTVNKIAEELGFSRQAIYKHLNILLKEDKVTKIGKPSRVFYLMKKQESSKHFQIDKKKRILLRKLLVLQ